MITLIIWIIFAFSCGSIAESKGYGKGLWFIIGVIFGIFALFVILILPNKNKNI